jgi:hypothetical protein
LLKVKTQKVGAELERERSLRVLNCAGMGV